jgi:hypothetical protein
LTFSDKPTPETEAAWNSIVPSRSNDAADEGLD